MDPLPSWRQHEGRTLFARREYPIGIHANDTEGKKARRKGKMFRGVVAAGPPAEPGKMQTDRRRKPGGEALRPPRGGPGAVPSRGHTETCACPSGYFFEERRPSGRIACPSFSLTREQARPCEGDPGPLPSARGPLGRRRPQPSPGPRSRPRSPKCRPITAGSSAWWASHTRGPRRYRPPREHTWGTAPAEPGRPGSCS